MMLLHRFTVKPRHLDTYLQLWPEEVALHRQAGFEMHRAFVETDAEPKLTWLYSHPQGMAAVDALHANPDFTRLRAQTAPHVFRNLTIRPVDVEVMTTATNLSLLAIMRRYSITGSWAEFLTIWRRIVPVRQRHGYPCLFAVADQPTNTFTWAFGFDGVWDDFPSGQQAYYRDPDRVALRQVFDYMADYSIHPARQLPIPAN